MQESISDLVFSCELADKLAYLTLLVEHQSSPDRAGVGTLCTGYSEALPWSMQDAEAMELLQLLLNYLLNAGNIEDINAFIKASTERLSGPVRSEIVTAAEKLMQKPLSMDCQVTATFGVFRYLQNTVKNSQ